MKFLRKFMMAVEKTNVFIGKMMVGVTLLAVTVITFEVVMRYVFERPTNWGHEFMTLLFAIQYFMAAGYAITIAPMCGWMCSTLRESPDQGLIWTFSPAYSFFFSPWCFSTPAGRSIGVHRP